MKSKWISLVLCVCTICGHKFYEGKWKVGLLYLFTAGLFGIGWIYDIVTLLSKPSKYYVESPRSSRGRNMTARSDDQRGGASSPPEYNLTFNDLLPDDGTIYPEYYHNYNREIENILNQRDEWALDRLKSIIKSGEDLVSFEDHGEPHCGYCARYLGRVYSISGKNKKYPPLPPYARKHGNFHHGCACTMYPHFEFNNTVALHGKDVNAVSASSRPYIDDRTAEERLRYQSSLRSIFDRAKEAYDYTDYEINHVDGNDYDFSALSDTELKKITDVIAISESDKYDERFRALGLLNESLPYRFKIGYILDEIIIQKYAVSESIYDLLAVAIVYRGKSAAFRSDAVEHFDKFFDRVSDSDLARIQRLFAFTREPGMSIALFSMYEKEGQFDKAAFYAEKALRADPQNTSLALSVAKMYEKYDPVLCAGYCEEILRSTKYDVIKSDIQKELEIARGRIENGYTYEAKTAKRNRKPLDRETAAAACAEHLLSMRLFSEAGNKSSQASPL